MTFEEILGKTKEVKILDLIIPLSDEDSFTPEEVAKGTGMYPKDVKRILDRFAKGNILVEYPGIGRGTYKKFKQSNQAWALNNLLHAIYTDKVRNENLKRMGKE